MVRSILFPKPTKFKFYEDSFKCIGVLAFFAFLGFTANSIAQVKFGGTLWTIIIRAGDLITITVPPSLPIVMSSGISYALTRL